jgi:hypothetical protein
VKNHLPVAGAVLVTAALTVSTLFAAGSPAQAVDSGSITVTAVDQFGQPAPVAVTLIGQTSGNHDETGGSATIISTTHVFTGLPADGYAVQAIGPWSGLDCFGIAAPCVVGGTVSAPVLTLAAGASGSYTAHVTLPTVTGGPAVGAPLTIQTSPGYQLMQALAVSLAHQPADISQQWLRGSLDIPNAAGPTYVSTATDGGQQLAARLTPGPAVSVVFAESGYAVQPFTTRPVAISKNATKTKAKLLRGAIRVKVKSTHGAVPTGKVKLSLGTFKAKAKLKKGKATVALPQSLQPGTYLLKVSYPGSTTFEKSKSKTVRISVR